MDWENVPFYPSPLIGWKALKWWKIDGVYTLSSPYRLYENVWHTPDHTIKNPNVSQCLYEPDGNVSMPHDSPTKKCPCGLYAYNILDDAMASDEYPACAFRATFLRDYTNNKAIRRAREAKEFVILLVIGMGRTIANDISWRSEYMKIMAVYRNSLVGREATDLLAKKLEVPALTLDEMKSYYQQILCT